MKKVNKWIQKAHLKKGGLSRQLGIPEKDNIPMTFLNKIVKAEKGSKVHNPTKMGKRVVTVTPLLKKRANMARNLKRIKH